MKILVIEDNALNRKLLSVILLSSGYTVLTASNASEGIRIAKEEQPAIAFINAYLFGVMNGFAAARKLKQDDATKHINVVAIADVIDREVEKRMYEAGYDTYVTNPIRIKALLEMISSFPKAQNNYG